MFPPSCKYSKDVHETVRLLLRLKSEIELGPGQLSLKEVAQNCLDSYYFMLEMLCGLDNLYTSIEILKGDNPCSSIRKAKQQQGEKNMCPWSVSRL